MAESVRFTENEQKAIEAAIPVISEWRLAVTDRAIRQRAERIVRTVIDAYCWDD